MSLIDGDGGRNLSLTQRNRTGLTNEIAKSYEAQQPRGLAHKPSLTDFMKMVVVALGFHGLLMADCYLWSMIFNLCLLSKNMRSLRLLLLQIFDTDTFASGFIRGTAVHSHWHCLCTLCVRWLMTTVIYDFLTWTWKAKIGRPNHFYPRSWNGLHYHSAAQDSKRFRPPKQIRKAAK